MITENYSDQSDAGSRHDATYYPLFLDIAAMTAKSEPDQDCSQKVYNAGELMELAIQYDCSEFQTMVLILKNAFEGHVFLTMGISSVTLYEQGTLHIDPARDSHCELSLNSKSSVAF